MANTPIKGLAGPTADGLRTAAYFHDGPTLYATGGETITAQQLGLKRIIAVQSSGSDNAAYFTTPVIALKNQSGVTSFKLVWSVVADGAEAGAIDLSSRFVTLIVIGR